MDKFGRSCRNYATRGLSKDCCDWWHSTSQPLLKKRHCTFERFSQDPALGIGDRVERLQSSPLHFQIQLRQPSCILHGLFKIDDLFQIQFGPEAAKIEKVTICRAFDERTREYVNASGIQLLALGERYTLKPCFPHKLVQCLAIRHTRIIAVLLEPVDHVDRRAHKCLVQGFACLSDALDPLDGLAALKTCALGCTVGGIMFLWRDCLFGWAGGEAGQVELLWFAKSQVAGHQAALSAELVRRSSSTSPVSWTALSTAASRPFTCWESSSNKLSRSMNIAL